MNMYLIDTVAVSEAVKSRQNEGYMNWLSNCDDSQLYLSCLTIGEINKGAYLTNDKVLRNKLENYLQGLYEAFTRRILDVSIEDASLWGQLLAQAQKKGESAPQVDALIAAQCINRKMILVTRNIKHFEQFGNLQVFCPWSDD
jgi:predicted nucleic acid-binding protein